MADPTPRTSWHTTESLRTWWSGAPEDAQVLVDLLTIAKQQVLAFAPALPADVTDDEIPTNYTFAQYRRAREMFESARANPGDNTEEIGLAGYTIRVARMSGAIKFILRPEPGVPGLG